MKRTTSKLPAPEPARHEITLHQPGLEAALTTLVEVVAQMARREADRAARDDDDPTLRHLKRAVEQRRLEVEQLRLEVEAAHCAQRRGDARLARQIGAVTARWEGTIDNVVDAVARARVRDLLGEINAVLSTDALLGD